jgi:hypothetical protein
MGVFRKDNLPVTPAVPASFSTPRNLTAAASQLRLKDKGEAERFKAMRASGAFEWQAEAWEYYDAIAEIKYAFNLVASVVSRIRLYAAVNEDPAEAPIPIRNASTVDEALAYAAERALSRLDSAYGGQAGLLRDAALNLSVAGECYLVQVPARIGQGLPETWDIRSVDELQVDQGGNYTIVPRRDLMQGSSFARGGQGGIRLPKDAFVGRIWRAHPRFSEEPDSSIKGVLDLCAELLLLNRMFRATERSRLNAGAMYIPDGLSNAATPDPDIDNGEFVDPTIAADMEDDFEDQLIAAMTAPIDDESSPHTVSPLLIRGPAELGDKIKQFKFDRAFDAMHIQRSDRVLERILQGIDVPKDTVTGLANVKYSNAVQIDESLYKAHIEPMLLLIADAITVVYIRPYLKSIGYSEAEVNRVVIWYDPSAVATRNDRAQDADAGFDKMAISFNTWRRAHGFSDADAPDPTELAMRIMLEKGSLSPELSEALLTVVAPEIMAAAKAAGQANSVAPVPTEVQNILQGGQPSAQAGAPTPDAGADAMPPTDAGATAEPAAQGAQADEAVPPGEDAPPFPEPTA